MNPQQRYRVLQFDTIGTVDGRPQSGEISIHDKVENTIIILVGDINSHLQLGQRKRKAQVATAAPTQKQIEMDDSAFVDEFAPDPEYANEHLR